MCPLKQRVVDKKDLGTCDYFTVALEAVVASLKCINLV